MARNKRRRAWVVSASVAAAVVAVVAGVLTAVAWAEQSKRGVEIRYVDIDAPPDGDGLSWATAYRHLTDALADADSNGQVGDIWVAAGTYTPDQGAAQTPGDRSASFRITPGLRLYGGFAGGEISLLDRNPRANPTVLSGDLAGDDVGFDNNDENSFHVVDARSATEGTLLDGFTICGGNADGGSSNNEGAGLILDGQDCISLLDCIFEWNFAYKQGAAATVAGDSEFVRCRFRNNLATVASGGSRGGSSSGRGGALYCRPNSQVAIANCEFQGNAGVHAGAILTEDAHLRVTSSTIVGNAVLRDSSATVECVGVADWVEVQNSILANNWRQVGFERRLSDVLAQLPSRDSRVEWTIVAPSAGQFTGLDALFVAPPTHRFDRYLPYVSFDVGDLHLRPGAAAIDAGNSDVDPSIGTNGVPASTTDLDGLSRFVDDPNSPDQGAGTPPFVDLGAYEFQPDDCNHNGVSDLVEIAAGTAMDCNANNVPDACDVLLGASRDCSTNGIPDACDIADGLLADADTNGIPDACLRFVSVRSYGGQGDGLSWATRYGHLSEALAEAEIDGKIQEIWVAEGKYLPDGGFGTVSGRKYPGNGNPALTFDLPEGVTILGGFSGTESAADQRDWRAHPTTLSGDLAFNDGVTGERSDNARHVVTVEGNALGTVLDGFIVTAGSAMDLYGGGMFVDGSPVSVRNCRFHHNVAGRGGAVYVLGIESSVATFKNCEFVANNATQDGGAVYVTSNCQVTLDKCLVAGNRASDYGGGLFVDYESGLMASHSSFVGNMAPFGGAVHNVGAGTLWHCDFVGHSHTAIDGSRGFVNCAEWVSEGDKSADLWFVRLPDDGGDGYGDYLGTPLIDESANDDYGDLRLRPGSPAIDAGTRINVGYIPYDAAGLPRYVDDPGTVDAPNTLDGPQPAVDLGAYEFQGVSGDLDQDGDIDLADHALFVECMAGPGVELPPTGCSTATFLRADLTGDFDVDLADFARLAQALQP